MECIGIWYVYLQLRHFSFKDYLKSNIQIPYSILHRDSDIHMSDTINKEV
jgi:hypothetical protein